MQPLILTLILALFNLAMTENMDTQLNDQAMSQILCNIGYENKVT